MDEVEHLYAAILVEAVLEEVAAGGTDGRDGRGLIHIVVNLPESPFFEIIEHCLETPLCFSKKNAVGVGGHVLGMEHGGNAAHDDGDPLFSKVIGDLVCPGELTREHDGEGNEVRIRGEVERLHVFVHETYLHMGGDRGGEDQRAVGRQVKLRLPFEFPPPGVYKEQFDQHLPERRSASPIMSLTGSPSKSRPLPSIARRP